MLRKSWILGLVAGFGLLAIAPAVRANDFFGANDTMPVSWGSHFGRGCGNCGSGYYAPYAGYGYYGSSNYGYGYAPSYSGGGWGASYAPAYPAPSGYWGATAAPAGYWHGYATSYSYGWGHPYSYGYGAGYPAAYGYGYGAGYPAAYGYGYGAGYPAAYGYGYAQPYLNGYYTPMSCSSCWTPTTYYYQPVATLAVPYAYAVPAVANFYTTTARVVAYPQAAPLAVAPQFAPSAPAYAPAAPQAPGFDYNGGPSNPVPMPRLEPQPAPASGPGIFNIRLADNDKSQSSKYAFKAYGEKATTSSSSQDKTILVKDVK